MKIIENLQSLNNDISIKNCILVDSFLELIGCFSQDIKEGYYIIDYDDDDNFYLNNRVDNSELLWVYCARKKYWSDDHKCYAIPSHISKYTIGDLPELNDWTGENIEAWIKEYMDRIDKILKLKAFL